MVTLAKLSAFLPLLMPSMLLCIIIAVFLAHAIRVTLADIVFLLAVGTCTAIGVHYLLGA